MKWIFGSILAWLVFVLSLASWWLYFGVTTLSAFTSDQSSEVARHKTMLLAEGLVLLFFLLAGGLALFYFSYRMYKEKSAKELFFASFTHDLKTSLFRLQLELEKLGQGDLGERVDPVLAHSRKMQLDLENGLDSAVGVSKPLFFESLSLKKFFSQLHTQWPEMSITVGGDVDELVADRKALLSVFKNLMHNSFVHGQADQVEVRCEKSGSQWLVHYSDNGGCFQGELARLGTIESSGSGNGFGLLIVHQWVKKMGGRLNFSLAESQALRVDIVLPVRSL